MNHRVVLMQHKCIEPLCESKADYQIFTDLAARLGREREDLQQQLAKAEEAWSALYDEA